MDFFEKRSPHLPLSFSLRKLYPIASYLQQILRHGTVALKMLSLMRLAMFHLDIFAEIHLSHFNQILQQNKIPRRLLFALGKISCASRCAQPTKSDKYIATDA
ncbi:hypothetical protein TNCV_21191 [Trichonephila clavipes]|nr:hypothetical protein TNCV_21191 [Trichonephila clavipes]